MSKDARNFRRENHSDEGLNLEHNLDSGKYSDQSGRKDYWRQHVNSVTQDQRKLEKARKATGETRIEYMQRIKRHAKEEEMQDMILRKREETLDQHDARRLQAATIMQEQQEQRIDQLRDQLGDQINDANIRCDRPDLNRTLSQEELATEQQNFITLAQQVNVSDDSLDTLRRTTDNRTFWEGANTIVGQLRENTQIRIQYNLEDENDENSSQVSESIDDEMNHTLTEVLFNHQTVKQSIQNGNYSLASRAINKNLRLLTTVKLMLDTLDNLSLDGGSEHNTSDNPNENADSE